MGRVYPFMLLHTDSTIDWHAGAAAQRGTRAQW